MLLRNRTFVILVALALFLSLPLVLAQNKAAASAMRLVASTSIPGISGDFDHFAVDVKGNRLFLAGEDHKTVEVFDVINGRHLQSIAGFGQPHSIFYLPASNQLLVTDGGTGVVQILRGTDYAFTGRIEDLPAADSARLDSSSNTLYVVTGGKDLQWDHSFLVAIDLRSNKKVGELRLESNHVEAMALDSSSSRLFINVTDKSEVAVIDRKSLKVLDRWPVQVAGENSPMAFDEKHHRLFLVCRQPAMLVVMDSDSGKIVAHLPAAARSDDVAFDEASGRIYVPGGEGFTSVFEEKSPVEYQEIARVPTAPGAKTCLLVPSLKRYFVAVSPGDSNAMAKILVFAVSS
jgi:DNA-binding beta-propeller fold protein YncE